MLAVTVMVKCIKTYKLFLEQSLNYKFLADTVYTSSTELFIQLANNNYDEESEDMPFFLLA